MTTMLSAANPSFLQAIDARAGAVTVLLVPGAWGLGALPDPWNWTAFVAVALFWICVAVLWMGRRN